MSDERFVFDSGREDGRFTTYEGFIHAQLKHAKPRLAFDPGMSAEHFEGWRYLVAEKLRELLVLPEDMWEQPEPKLLWSEPRDSYELQKWEAYPEPYCAISFLALIPDNATKRTPAAGVMCFPGSTHTKELLAGEPPIVDWAPENKFPGRNEMALQYAEAGFVAIAVDHPDTGERTNNMFGGNRYPAGINALWMGRNFEGISVAQKLPILEWLKSQPYVDAAKIAVSGHSLGALVALHLAAIEPSVAAVVWNDFFANWRERSVALNLPGWHIGHYIPGMQQWFDYVDIAAAIAPRPFLITEGGRTPDIIKASKAWVMLGKQAKLSVSYYPKYATSDDRQHDTDELFEGMTDEEYFEYANVDVPQHCFKPEIAVPWLQRVLSAEG